jgi:hypothetical protein
MHMNIYVFFQVLNILCSFWSTGFLVRFFSGRSGFEFLGSTGLVRFSVLITLYELHSEKYDIISFSEIETGVGA